VEAERANEVLLGTFIATFVYCDGGLLTRTSSFGVNQLVEMAVRALSPGINDPFTAPEEEDRQDSRSNRQAPEPSGRSNAIGITVMNGASIRGHTWASLPAAGSGTRLSSLTRDDSGNAVPNQRSTGLRQDSIPCSR
jgi:hypothetical protein